MRTNNVFTPESEKAALYLLGEAMGFSYQAALRAVAVLGVADYLVDGAKTAQQLGMELGVDAQNLHRVMRLLATRNIFHEETGDLFRLNPAAKLLCSSEPHSLRHAVLMLTDETFWGPLGNIAESVQGHSAFKQLYGMSFFEYWSKPQTRSPEYDFHSGMSSMSEVENLALVRSYNFPEGATVVDIAGGLGGLLLTVLQANPTLQGILFDQAPILARHRLGELADDARWRVQPGSFFESCPAADFYLLKYITHDWPDEKTIEILHNCRKAMLPNGKVLIMDTIIPEGNTPHFGKNMDLLLMASFDGGRERTEAELSELLAKAELKINRIIDTGSYVSIVEAVAR
ncbi:calO1 [Yersinia rohdei]|uniref:CalO1 n=3 Tax=Yersinia rohdei TaxID=29485 RepID=A0A0U1HQD9_YERRO|nr:methyltransferase [Yersinia rohdei]AJJ10282.1 calO1 [Yersinia rohdei]EEQ02352.1 Hydroxyneurosporene-O-methyltransferase [Yersinia rohdei ATCC 43380]MDN0095366.1 methyltransferase [Yersinia rohdei]CNF23493.1 Hydroxyneurosporene-O-methyltransferase [Yersinia rohdei]CNI49191.1 Hydroxyneurosporene-O-methyltransferase [Yersinia rohdei]